MTSPRRRSARTDVTSVMLRTALGASAAVVPVAGLVGLGLRGERGGLNALGGALTAVVFLTAGLAAIGPVVRGSGGLVMPAALVLYATLLALCFGVLRRVDALGGLDREAFALAALAGTLVWQSALTWAYAHGRHLIHDPEEGSRR